MLSSADEHRNATRAMTMKFAEMLVVPPQAVALDVPLTYGGSYMYVDSCEGNKTRAMIDYFYMIISIGGDARNIT